jgi:predicted phosphodiesterase
MEQWESAANCGRIRAELRRLAVDEQEAACVRIVIISDTHERHDELGVLRGDVLIHCGDGLNGFTRSAGALEQLDEWFGRQEFDRIFCTGATMTSSSRNALAPKSRSSGTLTTFKTSHDTTAA